MTATKPKRVYRHMIPLTPEQWALVWSVERLMWREAKRHAPRKFAGCDWAVEESYDVVRENVIRSARTFGPALGFTFGTYALKYAGCQVRQYWRRREKQAATLSLDWIDGDDGSPLREMIADPASLEDEPDTLDDVVWKAARQLCEKHRRAITLAKGIEGGPCRSVSEIAELMGLDKRAAGAMVNSAVVRLRELLGVVR